MKKIAVFMLALMMIVPSAIADDWLSRYNSMSTHYGLEPITKEMVLTDSDEYFMFDTGTARVTIAKSGEYAGVLAADPMEFISNSITVSLLITGASDGIVNSYGFIMAAFYEVASGSESGIGVFGSKMFKITKRDEKYYFVIGDA